MVTLQIEINETIEKKAINVLKKRGMSLPSAIQSYIVGLAEGNSIYNGNHEPNEETIKALNDVKKKKNLHYAKNYEDLLSCLNDR